MDIQTIQSSSGTTIESLSIKSDIVKPDVDKIKISDKEAEQQDVEKKAVEKQQELPEEEIQKQVDVINDVMTAMGKDLEFVLDERVDTGIVVKIFEKQSGDFIKQYPSEEILEIMDRIDQTITGALIDDKA